jgi:hypothetical protein
MEEYYSEWEDLHEVLPTLPQMGEEEVEDVLDFFSLEVEAA